MRKDWYVLMSPEGRPITRDFLSLIRVTQLNEFFAKHETGYMWKPLAAYKHEVYIGNLAA